MRSGSAIAERRKPRRPKSPSGVRFAPYKGLAALFTFGPAFAIAGIVALSIPDEDVPGIVQHSDGSITYVLQSVEQMIAPLAFVIGLMFFGFFAIRYALRKEQQAHPEEFEVPEGAETPLITRIILGVFLVPMAIILLWMCYFGFVLEPFMRIRTIQTTDDTIQLNSLALSWSVPRSDVRTVIVEEERFVKRRTLRPTLKLVTATNGTFRNVDIGYCEEEQEVRDRYREVFAKLELALSRER